MKSYIAVVATSGGKVTKFQDFDTADEAAAHVAAHGGFTSPRPSGNPAYWVVSGTDLTHDSVAEAVQVPKDAAMVEINRLEAEITPRRVREATLTDDGKTWLAAQEALIQAERDKL
jgi:hypothetical protein